MNKLTAVLFAGMAFLSITAFSQIIDNPKSSITFKIEGEGGANGSQVVYNPVKNIYYTVIAGNSSFPLEAFDMYGNNIYKTNTGIDIRGLWWNSKTKTLQGNGYSSGGIVEFALNSEGFPSLGHKVLYTGDNQQPDAHSVGTYDAKKKKVIYYHEGKVYAYKKSSGKLSGEVSLKVDDKYDISDNSLIYTGIKNMEIGILNHAEDKVYLYSRKGGEVKKKISLPRGVSQNNSFCFSYANGHVFIYNKQDRAWTGYKILQ